MLRLLLLGALLLHPGVRAAEAVAQERSDAGVPPAPSRDTAGAYLDGGARELVRRARERRREADLSIAAYRATSDERVSVRLRTPVRDRILWQREVASRIDWERDGPVRIEVLGAREVLPAMIPDAQVPADLAGYVPHLAFDPADRYLLSAWGDDGDGPLNPLAPGSESEYRFRSGDTTTIRLGGGEVVRLVELKVIPRRRVGNLVSGSLWLDAESHALVRTTFRPAADVAIEEGPLSVEVEYVTLEYGRWDGRWWLPRTYAVQGVATLGRLAAVPFEYQRRYAGYEVRAATPASDDAGTAAVGALEKRARCPGRLVLTVRAGRRGEEVSERAGEEPEEHEGRELTAAQRRECERLRVVLPEDGDALLASPALPPSPFDAGGLLTEAELRSIREQVEALDLPPWRLAAPRIRGPFGALDLVRYNRVEGLSLGARAVVDLSPLHAAATLRLGLADLEPRGDLALSREGTLTRLRLRAYRDLASMDADARPFSPGASLSALLLGRDEADYFDATGVELRGEPSLPRARWYAWRLYVQRERAADKETDLSLPRLLDGDHRFAANPAADSAGQAGGELRLRAAWGRDPTGFQLSVEPGVDAAAGTFAHARASLTVRAGFPLPGPLLGTLEAAGGTTTGATGIQHLWRVGGPASLRGYETGILAGAAFGRGRVEVATRFPAVRVVAFSDAGRAGPADRLWTDPWLWSAGAGVSALDGLVRVDLARALRAPTGWRLTAYLDAWR